MPFASLLGVSTPGGGRAGAGSAGLGFPAGLGAVGVWIGLSLGTAVCGALLVWRFHALTRRGYLPDVPAP